MTDAASGKDAAISGKAPSNESAFLALGGEAGLRAITNDFVDAVVQDMMIGFLFRGVDILRLKEREYSFAANHLGAGTAYEGRPLGKAHGPHRIMGGMFNRRLTILRNTLEQHRAPSWVVEEWLHYNETLRALITNDPSGECSIGNPGQKTDSNT